ncbi:hypothetical protein BGZ63DRAFT_406447 [Mariannaea sp. PMI_226]|nr:hypothetical protein BGZ63DRAFT_406447 [Mariannaea sp. PMI_226]
MSLALPSDVAVPRNRLLSKRITPYTGWASGGFCSAQKENGDWLPATDCTTMVAPQPGQEGPGSLCEIWCDDDTGTCNEAVCAVPIRVKPAYYSGKSYPDYEHNQEWCTYVDENNGRVDVLCNEGNGSTGDCTMFCDGRGDGACVGIPSQISIARFLDNFAYRSTQIAGKESEIASSQCSCTGGMEQYETVNDTSDSRNLALIAL